MREPNNPHDSDAVAVWIGAEKIGHISAYDAEELHEPIARVQRLQGRASCRALLTGGWDRGLGDRGAIGVTLDLHHEYVPWTTYDPIIIGRQRCTVTGVDDQQMLSGVLGDQTKRYGLAHLSRDADHRITVWINGVEIGRFTANMSSRYTPFLNRLQAHCPLTCTAVVERQPNSAIKVWAKLPQAKDFPLFGP